MGQARKAPARRPAVQKRVGAGLEQLTVKDIVNKRLSPARIEATSEALLGRPPALRVVT